MKEIFIKTSALEHDAVTDEDGDLNHTIQFKLGDTLVRVNLGINTLEDIILSELWVWYAEPSTKEHMRDAIRTLIVEGYHDGMDATEYMTLLDADLARNRIEEEGDDND